MKHIIILIPLALTLLGCRNFVDLEELPPVPEKEAIVDVNIQFSSPDAPWSEATKSYELEPWEEGQIKSIEFLVFNSSGSLVSRDRIDNPSSNTYQISTKSGSGMSIYVVTNTTLVVNASGTPTDVLGNVTTLAQLKDIKVTNLLSDVNNNRTMLMYGVLENVTITPGSGTSVAIPLNFVAAKITVNIRSTVASPSSFELVDWRLASMSRFSYIFPRAADAVTPGVANDFVSQTSSNNWKDTTINYSGTDYPTKTATFYLFENRRGVTSNTDPTLKSGPTAPLNASKMVARGYYKSPSGVTAVDINLMFGANSTNNYNIERTKQYTFNINVISLNNIDIDTRYTSAGAGFQAEVINPTLDAHYDFRPLRITAFAGTTTITIVQTDGSATNNTFWLKASQKNITKFIDNGSGTFIRPTYSPTLDMTQTITLVHNPTSGMDSKMIYLYSDELLTDNGLRSAKIIVTHTPVSGSALTPTEIPITQRGILLAGNVGLRSINSSSALTTSSYQLGLESIEEATIPITPGNLENERTMTMQWGFSGVSPLALNNFSLNNGFENTRTLVMSNTSTGALRTPYGRVGTSTITHQTYNPIYNTYSARYCFEKNRDLNGDGVIVGSEVKWYLPSVDEFLLIYAANTSWSTNANDLISSGNIYNTSSSYSTALNIATINSTGITGTTPNTNAANVRCVRQIAVGN